MAPGGRAVLIRQIFSSFLNPLVAILVVASLMSGKPKRVEENDGYRIFCFNPFAFNGLCFRRAGNALRRAPRISVHQLHTLSPLPADPLLSTTLFLSIEPDILVIKHLSGRAGSLLVEPRARSSGDWIDFPGPAEKSKPLEFIICHHHSRTPFLSEAINGI